MSTPSYTVLPMQQSVHSLKPSGACPFHVDAVRYVPEHSSLNGLTLIFLHAMNTHKEQFEPVLQHLLRQQQGLHIRDVWCIENPNHGSSALKNCALLDSPEYRDKWTAMDYCRAVHAFLTSTSHGIDFRARFLVGLAHSAASAPLLLLQRQYPTVEFQGLVFMDGAILPIGTRPTKVLCKLFGNWAKSKPNTWRSRAAAREELSKTAFRRWDPLAIESFVKHAIRPAENSTDVTLNCSTRQEAIYYLSPNADLIEAPTEIFLQLTKDNKLPIHSIICLNDEYKGMGTEMKQFQIDHVKRMRRGSVQIIEGGHMFPQTEPVLCARAIAQALERIQLREPLVLSRL
ncbi:Alpha/beta hydrolase fold-1 [Mycena alexandri]|uniref:Alpha/beta hydrolase fold-1 n=1 Tax=Mycena alexandri TaxID=1745969 RepID=A0AAD6TA48_9AGAR|nr:Alpha/beta hydrolase fold-1 [Mycena alexandri]